MAERNSSELFDDVFGRLVAMGAADGPVDGQALGLGDLPLDLIYALTLGEQLSQREIAQVTLMPPAGRTKITATLMRLTCSDGQAGVLFGYTHEPIDARASAATRFEQATRGVECVPLVDSAATVTLAQIAHDMPAFVQYER